MKYAFRKCGRILKCRVVRDIVTGMSKCYAFIEFESSADARNAVRNMNQRRVDDVPVIVDYECERSVQSRFIMQRFSFSSTLFVSEQ